MTRKYFYCESWFRGKKRATRPLSEDEARNLHEEGKPYCALVDSAENPTLFLEILHDYVGVGFLDEQLRENLSYQFVEKEPGKLFLSMAVWREFEGLSDTVKYGCSYIFNTDGSLTITRETFSPEHELEEAESTFDSKGNWEYYPDFGKYDAFLKVER